MSKTIQASEFPFKTKLNLSGLAQYWEANLTNNNIYSLYPTEEILKKIRNTPEIHSPIEDLKLIEQHKELIGFLMSAVMPSAMVESELSAALMPFSFKGFYATPGYQKLLPFNHVRKDLESSMKDNNMAAGKIARACIFILNKFYGTNIQLDEPLLVNIPDNDTGLKRIYKVDINTDFTEVNNIRKVKPIGAETISMLKDDIYNTELLLKHIEVDNFEFQGFVINRLIEVTVEEMISSIKYDLLKKDAVTCPDSFRMIQEKIRAIFQLPNMQLGLSFFDINNNIMSNQGFSGWNSFVMPELNGELKCDYFANSIYDRAFCLKRPVIIEDLDLMKNKTEIEKSLIKNDIRNVAVAPLIAEDQVIGMLELGTPYSGKINTVNAGKMESLLPMFTVAVRRVLEDMKTEVRALIQEECTAIHPSVEWRFLEEGYKIIGNQNNSKKAILADIVFPDVFPLYGLSDIRNSSLERNTAIQFDLKANLKAAKKVVKEISTFKPMPILNEISFRIDKEIRKISTGLNSGDETSVLDFLKNEIVPAFNHFKLIDEKHNTLIEEYEALLDPNLGVIYNKRKDFEESLTKINETISDYLDEVEEQAQQIFPHYFEKYKTDGVEYNIYIGQSMVKDKSFDKLYLNNFRLWQLLTQCEIATKVDQLKSTLPKPLDITQLILVHGEPLSIKFRKDEKHFDVDGAYNIRYEIVKKRIDKAYIKNTDERLTQPGKIAIVYTQQKEADEYMSYIEYLQSIDYLENTIEQLELEELQGAQGLKALRVTVNSKTKQRAFGNEVIQNVLDSINAN